jgi:NAD(P)-dependent dehydrogenase (short-subunit alcohol dehydrogenase family)
VLKEGEVRQTALEATMAKTSMVTGANGAIGLAICEGLATLGQRVVLVCRDRTRGQKALERVRRVASAQPELLVADLSRPSEIADLAEDWSGKLDVLVNNAAATPPRRTLNADGLEVQFATNILGYVWMMEAFRGALASAGSARIVNVASYWAGGLRVDDLEFKNRHYDNDSAYRQSKQANRMLTVSFARRYESDGIAVNACHPGDVPSKLARDLGFGGHETPEQGAATPVWLATEPSLEGATGGYYANQSKVRCGFADNRADIDALTAICLAHVEGSL